MVKSSEIYSPQNYLELVTQKCFCASGDNDIEFIEEVLRKNGFCLWSYDITEIDHIVENKIDVVLVDCMVYSEEKGEFEHVYRWFEV